MSGHAEAHVPHVKLTLPVRTCHNMSVLMLFWAAHMSHDMTARTVPGVRGCLLHVSCRNLYRIILRIAIFSLQYILSLSL